MNASQIILLLALVFLGLAAFNIPSPPRLSWGWLGLFLLALVQLVGPVRF